MNKIEITACDQCRKLFPEILYEKHAGDEPGTYVQRPFLCYDCKYNEKFIECKKCGYVVHETYWDDFKNLPNRYMIYSREDQTIKDVLYALMTGCKLYCFGCAHDIAIHTKNNFTS